MFMPSISLIYLNGQTLSSYIKYNLMLQEYAKLLVKPPKVLKDMELVEQPSDHESQCSCRANKHGKVS